MVAKTEKHRFLLFFFFGFFSFKIKREKLKKSGREAEAVNEKRARTDLVLSFTNHFVAFNYRNLRATG